MRTRLSRSTRDRSGCSGVVLTFFAGILEFIGELLGSIAGGLGGD